MVFALLVVLAVFALLIAGLSSASSGLTLANNYRTGLQAEQAAESGLVHAISAVNATGGITSFLTDVAPDSAWTGLFGASTKQMTNYSNISYTVTPATSPAATASNMWITSVGVAPGESTRTLNARLGLGGAYSCGAIDLPSTGITSNFNGNNFSVDGQNYAIGGTTPVSGSTATLGISTRTQTDANEVVSQLNPAQQNNVLGASVPNQVASVGACTGPSSTRVRNTIVPNILAQPGVSSLAGGNVNGNQTFGTVNSPQITYFNGDTTIRANGNSSGAGILIVNGGLTLEGSLDFTGLIIVLGTTQITTVTGNATVYGAIWTTDLSLTVGGSAAVRYSLDSLELANNIPGVAQQSLPQKVNAVAWSQS